MSVDTAILGRMLRAVSGTCRVCSCHGDSCGLPDGERCVWTDKLRTLCSAPQCQIAACKSKRKHKFAVAHAERDARAAGARRRSKRNGKGRAA